MRFLLSFALLAFSLLPASSHAETYAIDTAHSSVTFNVRHFVSKVKGSFRTFDAKLFFDEKDPKTASVEAAVHVASVDTNNAKRDAHLKNKDFFEVEKFPKMTFKSTKVLSVDGKAFKLEGQLTIKNVTKTVVLDVTYNGRVDNSRGRYVAGFNAKTTINRHDFGITYGTTAVIGKAITIEIDIEASVAKK